MPTTGAAQYHQRYLDCLTAISETRIVALGASVALENFPEGLPGSLPEDIKRSMLAFGRALVEAANEAQARGQQVTVEYPLEGLAEEFRPLGENALLLLTTYWMRHEQVGAENPPKPDVRSLVHAQELVMLLAHADGFLGDSLRSMCAVRPELLCRDKKTTWESIVKAGSYEALIDQLVEEYVYEFGWKSCRDRVELLRTSHGLVIPTAPSWLDVIADAELIRHVVVHNAGRVSHEYQRRSRRTDVKLGEHIRIDADFTDTVLRGVRTLIYDVYNGVVAKYF